MSLLVPVNGEYIDITMIYITRRRLSISRRKDMKKKVMALVLAGAMLIGGSFTALASEINTAESGAYSAKLEAESGIKTPTIKITVPTAVAVTLNPYKIKTTVGSNTDSQEQIVSDTYFIKNESNVEIRVDASLKMTPATGGKVVLASAPLTGKETTKSAFVYLDVSSSADGTTKYNYASELSFDKTSKSQIVGGKTAAKKTGLINLDAGDLSATYAKYTFGGGCATTNTEAWASTDTVAVELIWTFVPVLPTSSS